MTNKRDFLLDLVHNKANPGYIPAAFFMHFDDAHHQGQPAVEKHMEFFHYTGMDFVKIQYEQPLPCEVSIRTPEDWAKVPLLSEKFFEPTIRVAEGLVKAANHEALVVMTVYSPLMHAIRQGDAETVANHLYENPEAVAKGMSILTENVLRLVRGCMRVGVDGFYVSTQGGEATRFEDKSIFKNYIKPTDLTVWEEIHNARFNILHVCDYEGSYDDLTPFLDYPGHVVNCSLKLGDKTLAAKEVSKLFNRPFMGGLERKGVIATGDRQSIQQAVEEILSQALERFILAADCTVPAETPWENLKTAIEIAHGYSK
jgi:uroporphyrinogen decarboxylase